MLCSSTHHLPARAECVGATPNLDIRRATFQAALDALLAEPQPDLRNVALVRVLELEAIAGIISHHMRMVALLLLGPSL